MSVRKIIQLGDERLRKVCDPINVIDEETKNLIQDMKDTFYSVDGIGLAAPQIGITKRVVFIDMRDGSDPMVLINPVITKATGKEEGYEGCLSYVDFEGLVERPTYVEVEALDENGNKKKYKAKGLLARCFCHEIDHLEGIMYVDRAKEMYELVEEEDDQE